MMGYILVDRDVRKIPASGENSKINGHDFKKIKGKSKHCDLVVVIRVLEIQLESGAVMWKALNARVQGLEFFPRWKEVILNRV